MIFASCAGDKPCDSRAISRAGGSYAGSYAGSGSYSGSRIGGGGEGGAMGCSYSSRTAPPRGGDAGAGDSRWPRSGPGALPPGWIRSTGGRYTMSLFAWRMCAKMASSSSPLRAMPDPAPTDSPSAVTPPASRSLSISCLMSLAAS